MILTPDELSAVEVEVDAMCHRLAEMGCDSVRIFVTSPAANGNTGTLSRGTGNFYAQLGIIHDWSIRQTEITKAEARIGIEED